MVLGHDSSVHKDVYLGGKGGDDLSKEVNGAIDSYMTTVF